MIYEQKRRNKILNISLMVVIIFAISAFFSLTYATTYGTVDSDGEGLNLRARADTKGDVLMSIAEGEKLELLGQTNENGYLWYNVKYGAKTGYVVSDYVKITEGTLPVRKGIVNDNDIHMRSAPDTSKDNHLLWLYSGYEVNILGSTYQHGGSDVWYYIDYNGTKGFVHSAYVQSDMPTPPPVKPNLDFENQLKAFPDSYKGLLRQLHAQYPSWMFFPDNTGLDWNDVVKKEFGTPGITSQRYSLIHNSFPSAWKSKEKGDYDPATGRYTVYDSGGYVAASRGIIKYFMDPRNFLDSTYVFQFISSKYDPDAHTAEGLQHMLNNTFMEGMVPGENRTYNSVLMEAASISNVSPYTLAAMIIQEQGIDGRGGCISGTVSGYEGYYNYFNVGAAAGGGHDAVGNGLAYAKAHGWNSRRVSIIEGAKWYGRDYINNNQYTQYLKKFNVMNGFNQVPYHQYMTNIRGSYDEAGHLRSAYAYSLNSALTFRIPVYRNMPEKPCPIPTIDENGGWVISGENKLYRYPDGTYAKGYTAIDGRYYFFDKNTGYMQVGHIVDGNNAYQFYADTGYGYPAGWINYSNGKKAYCIGNGKLAVGKYTINGTEYEFDENGYLGINEGWVNVGNERRYRYSDGSYAKGYTKIEGRYYFFDKTNGNMQRGHVVDGNNAYQFYSDTGYGYPTGWINYSNGKKAYCIGNGKLAVGAYTIDGEEYIFDSNGFIIEKEGWINVGNERRYRYSDGSYAKGYTKIEGRYYFFNKTNGNMQRGHVVDGNNAYQFYSAEGYGYPTGWINYSNGKKAYCIGDGRLAVGRYMVNGKEYIFDENGFIRNTFGWITVGDEKRYIYSDGSYAKGYTKIEDRYYFFDRATGNMQRGHVADGDNIYQFYSAEGYGYPSGWINYGNGQKAYCLGNGKLATGYVTIGGRGYFFDRATGYMQVGKVVDGNNIYQFYYDEGYGYPSGWIDYGNGQKAYCLGNGKLAVGKKVISGKEYNFSAEGYLI